MLGSTKSDSPPPNSSCAMRAADASLSLECVGLHSGQSFSGSAGSASPFVVAQGLSDTSRSDCAVGCDRISAQPDSSPLNSSYAVKAADVSLPPVCVGLHSGQSPSRIPMGTSTFVQGLSVEDQADAISRPSAEISYGWLVVCLLMCVVARTCFPTATPGSPELGPVREDVACVRTLGSTRDSPRLCAGSYILSCRRLLSKLWPFSRTLDLRSV